MSRRPAVITLAALASVLGLAAARPLQRARTVSAITARDLEERLTRLAHDSLMGRMTGSDGAYKATAYIASEFKRLGLEPAGDSGTWFQNVPFWNAALDPKSELHVGSTKLEVGRDFLPVNIWAPAGTFDNTEVVFGGTVGDASKWIPTESASGKLVVLVTPPGPLMRAMQFQPEHWQGAAAIALVVLDKVGGEISARIRDGRPVTDTLRNPRQLPTLWITERAAGVLLGASPASLAPGAAGSHVSGSFDYSRQPVAYPARNVVAILRGSDSKLRGEYLALTAHNDHVGFDHAPADHDSLRAFNRIVRPMGADSPQREPTAEEQKRINTLLDSLRKTHRARPDSIRNGADDDASGTVSILEIAEAMAGAKVRPKRSILFVSHTAEEMGLLGSRWFADHATVPIDSIVGEIDQDMVGRGAVGDLPESGPTYLEVIGAKRLSREFGDSLEAANARQPKPFVFNYTFDAPGHPLQYYCRADHYNYARYGIPSVAFSRGEHLDYHQVTDESQYIDYPDLARVSKMVYDAAFAIGNAATRPKLDAPKPTDPNAPCRQ